MKQEPKSVEVVKKAFEQLQKTVKGIVEEVQENVCNNLCKYRDTADENLICDYIREHGNCPLDRLG